MVNKLELTSYSQNLTGANRIILYDPGKCFFTIVQQ